MRPATAHPMISQSTLAKVLLWFFLSLVLGSYICLPVSDPDLWWHIVVGRWIVAHHDVPSVDYWNMFSNGAPWRAYSWTNEIVFALVDRVWGMKGLAITQWIFGVALIAALQFTCGRLARDYCIGAFIGAYAGVACFNNFTLRPQVIVWILFAVTLMLADEVSEKGGRGKRLWIIALVGAVWANTHLTAILGLISIFLWSIQNSRGELNIKGAMCASLAFFVGTLVTPYLGGEWLTFFSAGGHPLKYSAIAEFQPANILQFSAVFVLLIVFLLLVVSYTTRVLPTLGRGVVVGGMLLAGLTAVKFLPFAAIAWCSLFCVWWRESGLLDRRRMNDNFAEGLVAAKERLMGLSVQTGLSIVFVMAAISIVNVANLLRMPLSPSVPKVALDIFEGRSLPHPLLHEFGTGGYVMYRFSDERGEPRYKVAIDGRTNVNGPDIWDMYRASLIGKAQWREFIDKVGAQTILWRQGSPFVSLLTLDPDWCQVFSTGPAEEDFTLFVTREVFETRRGDLASSDCR